MLTISFVIFRKTVKANGHIDELKLKLDANSDISDAYESQILEEKEKCAQKSDELENLVGDYKELFMRMGKQGEVLLQCEKLKEMADMKIQTLMHEKEEDKKKEEERIKEVVCLQVLKEEENERNRVALVESCAVTSREKEELKNKYEQLSTQFVQLKNKSDANIHTTSSPSHSPSSSSSSSSVYLNGDSSSSDHAHNNATQPLSQFTQSQILEMQHQNSEHLQQNTGMQQQIADMAVQLSTLRNERDSIEKSSVEQIDAMR